MAAPDQTVREVLKVIRRHVDQATLEKIVEDLQEVPGDKRFRDTIEMLVQAIQHENRG